MSQLFCRSRVSAPELQRGEIDRQWSRRGRGCVTLLSCYLSEGPSVFVLQLFGLLGGIGVGWVTIKTPNWSKQKCTRTVQLALQFTEKTLKSGLHAENSGLTAQNSELRTQISLQSYRTHGVLIRVRELQPTAKRLNDSTSQRHSDAQTLRHCQILKHDPLYSNIRGCPRKIMVKWCGD